MEDDVVNDVTIPVHLSLGMAHTVILMKNQSYVPTLPKPPPVEIVNPPEIIEEPIIEVEVVPPPIEPEPEPIVPIIEVVEIVHAVKRGMLIAEDEEEEEEETPAPTPPIPIAPVCLRDILNQREERAALRM